MAETWDEDKPAGSRSPTLGDDDIRELKRAIRERLAEDHQFEGAEDPAFGVVGGYKIGKHNFVTLVQRNTSKPTASDEVAFVCKDVSGNPEVILTPPSAGADRQLTKNSGANLNLNSGDFKNFIIKAGFYDSGSIDGDDLAELSVKMANLDTGAVGTAQLADESVDSDKFVDSSVDMKHLSAGLFQIMGDYEEKTAIGISYATVWKGAFLCPPDPTNLQLYARVRHPEDGSGFVKLKINGSTSIVTQSNSSYTWTDADDAIDISGLTPGAWYEMIISMRASDPGDVMYMQGFTIYQAS